MAKARDVEGLDPQGSFAEAAARVVAVRGAELLDHREGVLDMNDIERVHAMRVASRRLRAVLEIFAPAFDPGLHKGVLRDVKAIAGALGERRDPDVQLDHFQALRERLSPDDHEGVDVVLDQIQARQAAGNETLSAALDELEGADLPSRLDALVASAWTEEPRP